MSTYESAIALGRILALPGDEGEADWASVLRQWLPSAYHVVTKGRLLTAQGKLSPQMDVFILSPSYPPALLDKKVVLADGVLAALECKLTVTDQRPAELAAKNAILPFGPGVTASA